MLLPRSCASHQVTTAKDSRVDVLVPVSSAKGGDGRSPCIFTNVGWTFCCCTCCKNESTDHCWDDHHCKNANALKSNASSLSARRALKPKEFCLNKVSRPQVH